MWLIDVNMNVPIHRSKYNEEYYDSLLDGEACFTRIKWNVYRYIFGL